MKISIIVPVYNTQHYLEKCINSILNQTYRNIEVILVNDGSKDNSGEICDKYATIDKRIVVIHKQNGGVSSARNVGLDIITGDYVVFVDSDDWVECNMLKVLVEILVSNQYDVVMFGAYIDNIMRKRFDSLMFQKGDYNEKQKILTILPDLIREEKITSMCTKIYKVSIIRENHIRFNEKLSIAEDALFNYEVFMNIKSFRTVEDLLYHYMIRDVESLTKKYNQSKYEMLIHVNNYLHESIENGYLDLNILSAAQYIRVKNIYSCLLDLFNKKYNLTINEKKINIKKILSIEDIIFYRQLGNKKFEFLSWILSTRNMYLVYFILLLITKIRK